MNSNRELQNLVAKYNKAIESGSEIALRAVKKEIANSSYTEREIKRIAESAR